MSVGKRIKELRRGKLMTQQELSKSSGVAQATISEYENDVTTEHRAIVLMKIAAALETTPDYLLTGKGEKDLNNVRFLKSELINIIDQLTPEAQAAILVAAKAMIQTQ